MKGPCEDCGSSDALETYEDGHTHCFSCGKSTQVAGSDPSFCAVYHEIKGFQKRGITLATARKFGCGITNLWTLTGSETTVAHVFPLHDMNGRLVGQKIRPPRKKDIRIVGEKIDHLWGMHLWRQGGKMVVITEGEYDAMSMSQAFDNKWPVVSLPNGGSSAAKAIALSRAWLDQYERVVLMFDEDEAGRAAVELALEVGPPGRMYVASLPRKDANEVLQELNSPALVNAAWGARFHRPESLIVGGEALLAVVNKPVPESMPTGWPDLDEKIRGIRPREIVMLTAGSGTGKSTVARALCMNYAMKQGVRCGYVPLEETAQDAALRMAAQHFGKELWLDPTLIPKEDLDAYLMELGEKITFHDGFASLDVKPLLYTLRFMVQGLGCKIVFLDHISIVISGEGSAGDGNERRAIDELMTSLRSLCQEVDAAFVIVSHLKRPSLGKSWEEGRVPRLTDLRGSASLEQISNTVIALSRNSASEDMEIQTRLNVHVLKNRALARLGNAGALTYDMDTGQIRPITEANEAADLFEAV